MASPCFLRSHSQKKYVACAKRWTEKKSPGEASRQEREDEAVRSEVGGLHWLQMGGPQRRLAGVPMCGLGRSQNARIVS